MFCQQAGSAIFVSIGQNVFANEFVKGLRNVAGIDLTTIVATGATELRDKVSPSSLKAVLTAYNGALTNTFTAALAMSCFSIVGLLAMGWKSIKTRSKLVKLRRETQAGKASTNGVNGEKST